jgi:hypothetical protein
VSHVGLAFDGALLDASAIGRAVTAIIRRSEIAIHLDLLSIVHIATERAFNSFKIGAVSVAGELNASSKARPL